MITGRRSTDWLRDAGAAPGEGDRRAAERRAGDRRAPSRRFDPLFAATLVNQIAETETVPAIVVRSYGASAPRPRRGATFTLRA